MDDLDKAVLAALRNYHDQCGTVRELARSTGESEPSVRAAVKRLVRAGAVRMKKGVRFVEDSGGTYKQMCNLVVLRGVDKPSARSDERIIKLARCARAVKDAIVKECEGLDGDAARYIVAHAVAYWALENGQASELTAEINYAAGAVTLMSRMMKQ